MMRSYKILAIVVAIMLLAGIPAGWPYAYYQILRWVVCIAAALFAYEAHQEKKTVWMWVMVGLAVLFNPIAPIYLDKSAWVAIDVLAAAIMCATACVITGIQNHGKRN